MILRHKRETHEVFRNAVEQEKPIEQTLERLLAAAKGEIDAYVLFDSHTNVYYQFTGVGEVPPSVPDDGWYIAQLDQDGIIASAYDISQRLVTELTPGEKT